MAGDSLYGVKNFRNIKKRGVKDWIVFHKGTKGKQLFRKNVETCICTQCEKPMKKSLGDTQIENKRENAPICIPCCMGWKRKEYGRNYFRKVTARKIKKDGIDKTKQYKQQNLKELEDLFDR